MYLIFEILKKINRLDHHTEVEPQIVTLGRHYQDLICKITIFTFKIRSLAVLWRDTSYDHSHSSFRIQSKYDSNKVSSRDSKLSQRSMRLWLMLMELSPLERNAAREYSGCSELWSG